MSVSAFPYGVISQLAAGDSPGVTVAMPTSMSVEPPGDEINPRTATIDVSRGGVLASSNLSYAFTSWVAPGDRTADIGDFYEVRLTKSTGSDPTFGSLALNTWYTISEDRQWFWTQSGSGTTSFTGTFTVREIADTANTDSSSVTVTATV